MHTSPGSTTNFTVEAAGSGPLVYQWRFNDSPIPGGTSARLTLTNVQPGNAGNYRVVVSNPYESVTSAVVVLTVTCPGTNVVFVASDAALRSAMAIGGNVRLCFSGTVTLTNAIDVIKDTSLDASGVSVAISGNNAVRLFAVGTNVTFNVTNLMLANGRYIGTNGSSAGSIPGQSAQPGEDADGGAINNRGGVVRVVSCVLSNNSVLGGNGGTPNQPNPNMPAGGKARGGAVFSVGGTVYLLDSLLVTNFVAGGVAATDGIGQSGTNGVATGGAVYCSGGSLITVGCLFADNWCTNRATYPNPGTASGGAIYAEAGNGLITNCVFTQNKTITQDTIIGGLGAGAGAGAVYGGAICLILENAALYECLIQSNSASGGYARLTTPGSAFGGAIYNGGILNLTRCSFSGNSANGGGGGSAAPAAGGGLCNTGVLSLVMSAIYNNAARGGGGRSTGAQTGTPGGDATGGALHNEGFLFVTNCTLTENVTIGGARGGLNVPSGKASGGAIFSSGGSASFRNVTIASNSANQVPFPGPSFGANVAATNSIVALWNSLLAANSNNVWGTVTDGGYNLSSDDSANFSSGSSFNFTDPKLAPLANNGGPTMTMALLPDSPAIDWAPAAGAPTTDQRGVPRPFGAGVDLGAFEVGPDVPSLSARRNGSSVNISFPGEVGLSYRIEHSSDLITWKLEETTGVLNANGVVTRSYQMTEPIRFYRLALDF